MPHQFTLEILDQREVAKEHWEMVLPRAGLPAMAKPGQFVNVLCRDDDAHDPLLRRPFSVYRAGDTAFSILYRVVGRGTGRLARLAAGDSVDVVGPLGTGFTYDDLQETDRVALVGGGVGVPPLFYLSQRLVERNISPLVLTGFATNDQIIAVQEWWKAGTKAEVATDDGSFGTRGLVTDLLRPRLAAHELRRVYACGPRPMLEAVARLCDTEGIPSQLAMEEWMGCGIGACLSCVCRVYDDGPRQGSDGENRSKWVRICREGPVLDGSKVVWRSAP